MTDSDELGENIQGNDDKTKAAAAIYRHIL